MISVFLQLEYLINAVCRGSIVGHFKAHDNRLRRSSKIVRARSPPVGPSSPGRSSGRKPWWWSSWADAVGEVVGPLVPPRGDSFAGGRHGNALTVGQCWSTREWPQREGRR